MKKIKILLMVIIAIGLVIFCVTNIKSTYADNWISYGFAYGANGSFELGASGINCDYDAERNLYLINWHTLNYYDNIYCVQYGKRLLSGKYWYGITAKAEIRGTSVYFTEYDENGNVIDTSSVDIVHDDNNKIAAILAEQGLNLGHKSSQATFRGSQRLLFKFWNGWVKAVGADEYGFESYYYNDYPNARYFRESDGVPSYLGTHYEYQTWYTKTNGTTGKPNLDTSYQSARLDTITNQMYTYANNNTYNVTIYYLKEKGVGPNNPGGSNWENIDAQNIIIVDRNPPEPEKLEVPVTKVWLDNNNSYDTRPNEITVKLLANDEDTGKTLALNDENNWTGKFTELDIADANNQTIQYTVDEIDENSYYETTGPTGNQTGGFIITNRLKTQVTVKKEWKDEDNLDEMRKNPLTVTLYSNGTSTGKTVTLSGNNNWTATFTDLYKCDTNGNVIDYTVQEETVDGYTGVYSDKKEDSEGNITYTITNTHTPSYDGYIEITGKVWLDGSIGKGNDINGTFGEEDTPLSGQTVTLRDANGNQFDATSTTKTGEDGTYVIKVNYDNSQNVYKLYENEETVKTKLQTAYVEFEYDGMKYTTVKTETTGANTSKAIEDETMRNNFDNSHSKVEAETKHPDNWTDKTMKAKTAGVISFETYTDKTTKTTQEVLKYCNGDGTYTRTDPAGAWNVITSNHTCENCTGTGHSMRTYNVEVGIIQNVNLGLFEKEQPSVALFSDLTKVKVVMNNQEYTYLYGVRSNKYDKEDENYLQVKFQNKDTYTYRRPVNPADIAYIQEETNKDAMSVFVTYEIKAGNLSTTLPVTINSIINCYETEYEIQNVVKDGQNIEYTDSSIYPATQQSKAKEITMNNLNIQVEPQKESSAIQITYKVSVEAIRNLLKEEATLNNGAEIGSYSTTYGEQTLYAQQQTGEREGEPYAGYDYDSHPRNAKIFLNDDTGRLEAEKAEPDTDFAPSFVLHKDTDTAKTISGTIWEDTDVTENEERLGNGYYDGIEKNVENVKVELYKKDGTIAKLYDNEGNEKGDAIVYTDANGSYSFEGIVTDEYFVKFTYGDDTAELAHEATTMDGGTTIINARNHKSTIITEPIIKNIINKNYTEFSEEDKMWHITHTDGYSVAVDNMLDRLNMGELKYSNFNDGYIEPQNMTAYTKPFKLQVEYEATGKSQVQATEQELANGEIEGKINVTNNLSNLDFGIIERPRENLYVQKDITYVKVQLSNGQVLLEGNPTDSSQNINYTKKMGIFEDANNYEEGSMYSNRLLIEMDAELTQGAQLDMQYEVRITNKNEIDYDYGDSDDYGDIIAEVASGESDKYITTSEKAKYYYFGDKTGFNDEDILKSTIEFADYLDKTVAYEVDEDKWASIDINDLYSNGLVSEEVKDKVENEYIVFRNTLNEAGTSKITLERGDVYTLDMSARKTLANQDENVYDNNLEILVVDGKTGRTIKESYNGVQVAKAYKPGNYIPETDANEQDDDGAEVIITPPTGITNYITTYLIAGLVGLIVVVIGIVFIKKKVLTK